MTVRNLQQYREQKATKPGDSLTPAQYRDYLAGGPYRIELTEQQKENILREYTRGLALQELKRVNIKELLEEIDDGR